MWAKSAVVALCLLCLSGCISQPHYRPCGPGFLNNALVPQGFAGVDFRRSCQKHDNCYEAGCNRKACDDRFLNDMLRDCECSPCKGLCRLRAWQWYAQVRLFGGMGSDSPGNGGHGGCRGCNQCGCPRCSACQPCQPCQQPSTEY